MSIRSPVGKGFAEGIKLFHRLGRRACLGGYPSGTQSQAGLKASAAPFRQ